MKHQSCTSILVGKKASLNNSVIIGRNEDFGLVINRKTFKIFEPQNIQDNVYESANTKVKIKLPSEGYRHSGNPSDDPNEIGNYTEAAINEKNVAISATESLYGNEKVLSYDPLVSDGIAEDAIVDLVIPFINSAIEGVEYLGLLIEKYGSAEGNGVLFADKDECWYMEIPCGHHWVAIRIPDDCYAIAPNQVSIEEIDFDDNANYRYSTNILEFVEKYHLNPNPNTFNFRNIFGTSNKLDRVYNTPRAWFGHRLFNPENTYGPEDSIPFIQKANRLISIEDVDYFLSSHYNETPFDPIGKGSDEVKTKYRAVSLSRTQESHILEIRDYCDDLVNAVHYTAFGTTAFTPYIPFFVNSHNVDESISTVPLELDLNNAYWLFKVISYYTETHYKLLEIDNNEYLKNMQMLARKRILEITENFENNRDNYLDYFTEENNKTLKLFMDASKKYLNKCMTKALSQSKLSFKMDDNL